MIISFDLDDTLVPGTKRFDTASKGPLHRLFSLEPLRMDTVVLMKELQARGHKVYVYTTSFRSISKIWWTFFIVGVRLDKIINQKVHNRVLRDQARLYSKYPPAFHIDLHIDDAMGVAIEGERFQFNTLIIDEMDLNWTAFVLKVVSAMSSG